MNIPKHITDERLGANIVIRISIIVILTFATFRFFHRVAINKIVTICGTCTTVDKKANNITVEIEIVPHNHKCEKWNPSLLSLMKLNKIIRIIDSFRSPRYKLMVNRIIVVMAMKITCRML